MSNSSKYKWISVIVLLGIAGLSVISDLIEVEYFVFLHIMSLFVLYVVSVVGSLYYITKQNDGHMGDILCDFWKCRVSTPTPREHLFLALTFYKVLPGILVLIIGDAAIKILSLCWFAITFIPFICLFVRRLKSVGLSAWGLLFLLVPITNVVVLVDTNKKHSKKSKK